MVKAVAEKLGKPRAAVKQVIDRVNKVVRKGGIMQQAEEARLMRVAAKRAMLATTPPDQLHKLRLMEARAKGSFTRTIGMLIMKTGISPLEYLIREMRDVNNPKDVRQQCAVAALPYIHAKVPTEVKVDNPGGGDINFYNVQQTQLENLTDEEFNSLAALADKLRPPIDVEHTRE